MNWSVEELSALHRASFDRGWSAGEFTNLLQQPVNHLVTNGFGFAILQIIPPEAEILTIAVRPDARGRGHGRALVSETLQTASERGATRLFLEVNASNLPALALYQRAGFKETGRRHGYYAQSDGSRADAVNMTLTLT